MTKTEKIRRALLKYPKLKAKDLANKIGVSVQDVYSTRYLAKKQNKANGYAPLEMKEGVEVGGLTLTKGKDSMYKWVNKNDRFHNAVAGAVVAGMEQAPNMRTEMLKEVMPGLNSLFGTDYAGNPSEVTIKEDMVNHPPHYTVGGIEVIDFIEAKDLNYRLGQVIKYVSRAGKKGDALQDLQKARWYLNREIARVE